MLTARSVITATISVAVLSVILGSLSLLQPRDSGGVGGDSYGTRAHGLRAVFEILNELNVSTQRSTAPPTKSLRDDTVLVLWGPHIGLVTLEPKYLHAVRDWVHQGGRVVVAPSASEFGFVEIMRQRGSPETGEPNVLVHLGLENVDVTSSYLISAEEADDADEEYESNFDEFRDSFREAFVPDDIPDRTITVRATGEWSAWKHAASALEVPGNDLQVVDVGDSQPAATLKFEEEAGDERIVAALFRQGAGEIVVVGDPTLAQNRRIANADNSVLMAHLLFQDGATVVFDEFYHGLTLRGNPLWLFTQREYTTVTIVLLTGVAFLIWRQAVFLGPPLEAASKSRRSIAEYVDAMARFFQRGESAHTFVLQTVRDGVLRAISRELGLLPGREHLEEVTAALSRRDADRSKQLAAAVAGIDAAVSGNGRITEKETIQALQRITACL